MIINDNSVNNGSRASYFEQQQAFKRQLGGFGALGGVPHWQMDNHLDSAAMERHLANARKIRANTLRNSLGGLGSALGKVWSNHLEKQKTRRNLHELSSLSDRNLRDIGVSRGDVSALVAGALSVNEFNAQRHALSEPRVPATPKQSTVISMEARHCRPTECTNDLVIDYAA